MEQFLKLHSFYKDEILKLRYLSHVFEILDIH